MADQFYPNPSDDQPSDDRDKYMKAQASFSRQFLEANGHAFPQDALDSLIWTLATFPDSLTQLQAMVESTRAEFNSDLNDDELCLVPELTTTFSGDLRPRVTYIDPATMTLVTEPYPADPDPTTDEPSANPYRP